MSAGRALLVVIPAVLSGSLALAEQAPPPPDAKKVPAAEAKSAPSPESVAARSAGGLVVFVDPVTGKIRQPDPAEIGALTAPRSGAAAPSGVEPPLEMKFGPGGAVGIVLDSRYESFMVVTRAPDGKLTTSCVAGKQEAEKVVTDGVKPAPKIAAGPDGKEAPHAP